MSGYSESIYSPDTSDQRPFDQALVQRQAQFQVQVQQWHEMRMREQAAIDAQKAEADRKMALAREQEARNWSEADKIRSDRLASEHRAAVLDSEKQLVLKKERHLQTIEEERRRDRTDSQVYIEDRFPHLNPSAIVDLLTHHSPRVRDHVMKNLTTCINGSSNVQPPLVSFKAEDVAPFLLPKLHQLLSSTAIPTEDVIKFSEDVVSSPSMAKALAMCGECPQLADYLIQLNHYVSRLAVSGFRAMARKETAVVVAAYRALATAIPEIPTDDPDHPAVNFIQEVTPKIIDDCFSNARFTAIQPLITHQLSSIRTVALPKVVFAAQTVDRNQHGLVEAGIMEMLDTYYTLPTPPEEVTDFFVKLVPVLAIRLCRRTESVNWLLNRLSDPSPKINKTASYALRLGALKQDPTIHDIFVKAKVLKRLDEPPTQPSLDITKLICDLLPVLALAYARKERCAAIAGFLDHPESVVSNAALMACTRIVESSIENRSQLYAAFIHLNFLKESTLMLCDIAMPAFCKDWASLGEFAKITKEVTDQEVRRRMPAHRVWREVVASTPSARAKIVSDNLLGMFFELCTSPYDDCVTLAGQTIPYMALEISRSGVRHVRQLLEFLFHPLPELRRATLHTIQIIAEGADADRAVLVSAEGFDSVKRSLLQHPGDSVESAARILACMAPAVSAVPDSCSSLLELTESTLPEVEEAARRALTRISSTNIQYRQTLRQVLLKRLVIASESMIEYAARAIQDWVGHDLAQLHDFTTFFQLVEHTDKRIQSSALMSLRQHIHNPYYQESLEKANMASLLRTLAASNNPEATNFIIFALPVLALTLARKGHVSVLLQLLACDEPKVRESASDAIEVVASGNEADRAKLLEADVIEIILGGNQPRLDQTDLQVILKITPKLALDYLNTGKVKVIFGMLDHPQDPIRAAARKAFATYATANPDQRVILREALLPALVTASPALREIASTLLNRGIARDLVVTGEFKPIFELFESGDAEVRATAISELRNAIQGSDDEVRRRLVNAGILPVILSAIENPKEDLVVFFVDHVLPNFGPTFSQCDGCASLFPLLTHQEPRIRLATVFAIRTAVDSRHGNTLQMVERGMVTRLHSLMDNDSGIRELWSYILPRSAPFVTSRAEIDLLMNCLTDSRSDVRSASREAVMILAKKSEETRRNLFPSLCRRLEAPPSDTVELLAHAISLSGFAFMAEGEEGKLVNLTRDEELDFTEGAVTALKQVLSKGAAHDQQKLMKAGLFSAAMELYCLPSQRDLALTLLVDIITHLTHEIVLNIDDAEKLFTLFEDQDLGLAQALTHSIADDAKVSERIVNTPELINLLSRRIDNSPAVASVMCKLSMDVTDRLLAIRQLSVLATLMGADTQIVAKAYMEAARSWVHGSNEEEKDTLAFSNEIVQLLIEYLKSRNGPLRRLASEIVEHLSRRSSSRSGRLMELGVGNSLAYIAVFGDTSAQRTSLDALKSFFQAAPDHADQLVGDCLPAIHDILEDVNRSSEAYQSSFSLLAGIASSSSYTMKLTDGITDILVVWLSPQYSNQDPICREYVFAIVLSVAKHSDHCRSALLESKILPSLIRLLEDTNPKNVVGACDILNALAHSGTFRRRIVDDGARNALEHLNSPFRRSKLRSSERKEAQEAARRALTTLKSTKNASTPQPVAPTVQTGMAPPGARQPQARFRRTSTVNTNERDLPAAPPAQARRTASDSEVPTRNTATARDSASPLGRSQSMQTNARPTTWATNGSSRLSRVEEDRAGASRSDRLPDNRFEEVDEEEEEEPQGQGYDQEEEEDQNHYEIDPRGEITLSHRATIANGGRRRGQGYSLSQPPPSYKTDPVSRSSSLRDNGPARPTRFNTTGGASRGRRFLASRGE